MNEHALPLKMIKHKFLDHEIDPATETLIIGTFNPLADGNTAEFFYSRLPINDQEGLDAWNQSAVALERGHYLRCGRPGLCGDRGIDRSGDVAQGVGHGRRARDRQERRFEHVGHRRQRRKGPLHLPRLQQSAYAALRGRVGPAVACTRVSALGARRGPIRRMAAAMGRLEAEGWLAEGSAEYGFVFIRRAGERRLLMLTPRDPCRTTSQSFSPFRSAR